MSDPNYRRAALDSALALVASAGADELEDAADSATLFAALEALQRALGVDGADVEVLGRVGAAESLQVRERGIATGLRRAAVCLARQAQVDGDRPFRSRLLDELARELRDRARQVAGAVADEPKTHT